MMVKIPPEILQQLRAKVNIIGVIGEAVVLKKSGTNYSGLCPFHQERSPSFSVSETKQLYHCFGCKRGGDIFQFLMDHRGMGFGEAVQELADRAGVKLSQEIQGALRGDGSQNAAHQKKSVAQKLNRFVASFYHQRLKQEGTGYLEERGIKDPTLIQNFYLGSSSLEWDTLYRHLEKSKAPIELALELGLIKAGKETPFDLFRGRAMFPISDLQGKVIGFGGRSFSNSKDQPKYLNSSDSFLFKKSKALYGLFQAHKYIREYDSVILVEGYFDVLAMHQAGFQNTVATCGTALTSEHLELLGRIAGKVILLFDGDQAGQDAMVKAMELGLKHGKVLYGAILPEGMDPDELLLEKNGTEKMRALLEGAEPLFDRVIEETIQAGKKGLEEKTQAVKQLKAWFALYSDPVGREIRVTSVAERFQIPREMLLPGVVSSGPKKPVQSLPQPKTMPTRAVPTTFSLKSLDLELLKAWILGGQYVSFFEEIELELPQDVTLVDLFDIPQLRNDLIELGLKHTQNRMNKNNSGWNLDYPWHAQIRSTLIEAEMGTLKSPSLEQTHHELRKRLQRVWARFSQALRSELDKAELNKDTDLELKLKKDYLDVQRRMKEFKNLYD